MLVLVDIYKYIESVEFVEVKTYCFVYSFLIVFLYFIFGFVFLFESLQYFIFYISLLCDVQLINFT